MDNYYKINMMTLDNTGSARSITSSAQVPAAKALQDKELTYGLISVAVADYAKSEISNIGASGVFYCKD